MLHKKEYSQSLSFFLCSKLFSPPRFALPFPPNWRTLIRPRSLPRGTCRAPRVVIGPWRTATIDTAHRNGISVRLFGGAPRRLLRSLPHGRNDKGAVANPKIAEQADVPLKPLRGALGCSASPNCRTEHPNVPPGCLEC